ncbi:MAG: 5'/3'-nucleotidase SurE [Gammaproteobacteria bacterium]|nr:5'/3'-nucleotidase SurE [Gammaproteobacteria bacterium]MCY4210742.1 5'/3'-nucleotidase SurE [Gammaproteobacteria bacterium]MCY4282092.1 5'/3'-nucleotidase SurE [Gammaproteobacteria bacterium]MCY4339655.1 5'/3'-nucleotidase SurE [Gammaproteobacteria bacterium]
MHFLLSNDDGYQAVGLDILRRELQAFGRITVVAPDRNRSGASNSLTLDAPLYTTQVADRFFHINGTPTDCVHLAITGLLAEDDMPDMVLSGVNHGANLGDDVLYSGTVAAAMEGRFLGRPAIALSLAGNNPTHYETAGTVVANLVGKLLADPLDNDLLLNINIPDVPFEQLDGMVVTRLGQRHKSEPMVRMADPNNRPIYWVGPVGAGADAGPGTDFHAIAANKVSITPLRVDLTRHEALPRVREWLDDVLAV